MTTVAIAQARMGSARVPGKVMRNLHGRPVLRWTIDALRQAAGIDRVILATSTLPADDVIADYCKSSGIECYRGSETDVLDRYYQAAMRAGADVVLRLTCDCPLLDPQVIGEVVRLREIESADYASNVDPPTYPDGLDVEVFTWDALEIAWREASRHSDRDTVTQYISRNRSRFKVVNATCPVPGLGKERWVLDTEDDWQFINTLVGKLSSAPTSYLRVLSVLDKNPELRKLNGDGVRNERFLAGLAEEELGLRSFEYSRRLLERSKAVIPFGAQTFSKSYLQFPEGAAPLYASHADGARIFDVDGNDYLDLVSAILPVVLGYRDPDVDQAIRHQLNQGISLSLATELEAELAELLCTIIPCAEMVKFGKTGTDVTTAAVRLARAYTGRNIVALSGYHGWADWSMAPTDRNLGIPEEVRRLSVRIPYGDPAQTLFILDRHMTDVAAIVVEPNDQPTYLQWLRQVCDERGIVLIFDEVITGFRYALGGAQKLFGVTPDLATFGKAMANGMPLSAVVGRKDIMRKAEPPNNIFFSGTMFGETLSLAASLATIEKMQRENVIDHLWQMGLSMNRVALNAIESWDLGHYIKMGGLAPRRTITIQGDDVVSADKIRTIFLSMMAEQGVLVINSHNISFAHREHDLVRLRKAYDDTCGCIRCMLDNGGFEEVVPTGAAPLRATA